MDRRNFLRNTGALASGAAIAAASQGQAFASSHNHAKVKGAKYDAVIKATHECIQTGEACISHCIALMGAGDTSMKDCLNAAQNMLATCTSMSKVAASGTDAKLIKKLAAVCAMACRTCEEACKKHSDKHAMCKKCQDSCAKCAKACEAIS
jgi:Cys-rich four helix bundle protein (predicted Tat secretion target)